MAPGRGIDEYLDKLKTGRAVWDRERRFTTRMAPSATTLADRPVYSPGLTRLG